MGFNAKHPSYSKAKQGRQVSSGLTVVKQRMHQRDQNQQEASREDTVRRALKEMRHNFAIKALEKPGFFKPRPYLYHCIRCKWTFRVNDRRGSVSAVDKSEHPLPSGENAKRIATFAEGPCPGFSGIATRS